MNAKKTAELNVMRGNRDRWQRARAENGPGRPPRAREQWMVVIRSPDWLDYIPFLSDLMVGKRREGLVPGALRDRRPAGGRRRALLHHRRGRPGARRQPRERSRVHR